MNSFLTPLNFFYTTYYGKDPLRFWSEQVATTLFAQRNGKVIVETGTIRPFDGDSTLIWGNVAKHFGARLYTVDNEPDKIEYAKDITQEYKDNIEYVLSDSVEFLKNFDKTIDFLYLDSYDFPLDLDEKELFACQNHNLNEILAAEDKFTHNTIILIDDFDFPHEGKAGLSNDYLVKNGWECLVHSKQILWVKR